MPTVHMIDKLDNTTKPAQRLNITAVWEAMRNKLIGRYESCVCQALAAYPNPCPPTISRMLIRTPAPDQPRPAIQERH